MIENNRLAVLEQQILFLHESGKKYEYSACLKLTPTWKIEKKSTTNYDVHDETITYKCRFHITKFQVIPC